MLVATPRKKKPARTGKPLSVFIDPSLREAIDNAVDAIRPTTTLTAIVEQALEEYLGRLGHWPPASQADDD